MVVLLKNFLIFPEIFQFEFHFEFEFDVLSSSLPIVFINTNMMRVLFIGVNFGTFCYINFLPQILPGLDVHIGLPLSENYRTAKSEQTILRSLEDWKALFFDEQWMLPYVYLTNKPAYRIFANVKDVVSTVYRT